MAGTTRPSRRATPKGSSDPVRVVVPPGELHERLVRLGGEARPASGPPWRERLRLALREPLGRRSLVHLIVVALPLVVSLILLLLGLPGDSSLGW
jgi:hypothetical protein